MKKEIIEKMAKIVDETMICFKSDFEQDLKELLNYDGKFIWQVAKSHTHLHLCDNAYLDKLLEKECTLYAFCQGNTWIDACLDCYCSDEKIYSYDNDNDVFCEISREEAKRRWSISKEAALNRWQLNNMSPLPSDFKMHIVFMHRDTRLYFIKQLRYANQHSDDSLLDCVRRFRRYRKIGASHKIVISRDPYSERSFLFHEDFGNGHYGLNGGIIFHGYPDEGYRESGSVQLTPSYGWSIHT